MDLDQSCFNITATALFIILPLHLWSTSIVTRVLSNPASIDSSLWELLSRLIYFTYLLDAGTHSTVLDWLIDWAGFNVSTNTVEVIWKTVLHTQLTNDSNVYAKRYSQASHPPLWVSHTFSSNTTCPANYRHRLKRVARRYLVRVAVWERLATLAALQWSVACMQFHHVVLEICLAATCRRTQLTLEDWLVTRMD